jgi:hypothetical protein
MQLTHHAIKAEADKAMKVGGLHRPGSRKLLEKTPHAPLHAYVRPDTHQLASISPRFLLENIIPS